MDRCGKTLEVSAACRVYEFDSYKGIWSENEICYIEYDKEY